MGFFLCTYFIFLHGPAYVKASEKKYEVRTRAYTELYLDKGGVTMRFYTIKLPKFLGGLIRAILGGGKR